MESERAAKKRKLAPTQSFNQSWSQLSQQPSFTDVLERLKEEAAGVVGEFHSFISEKRGSADQGHLNKMSRAELINGQGHRFGSLTRRKTL